MQVITTLPSGEDRAYQFAMIARDPPKECLKDDGSLKEEECNDPDATYGLTFRYPLDEAAEKRRVTEARMQKARDEAPIRREQAQFVTSRERLDVDFFNGGACRNYAYEAEGNEAGKATLVPEKGSPSDNGQETAFRYAGNRDIPSFFIPSNNGKDEQPIRPRVQNGDTVILPLTAPEIRARIGEAVLYVYNLRHNAVGCDPGTFTTRRDVIRNVRRAPPVRVARQ